jgi:probable F420-dependent oxidoreductase
MTAARAFRFGVVAAGAQSGDDWLNKARRIESLGYSTMVMPDVLDHVPAAFPALAVAATATGHLRVGTYVLANDYRNPFMTAREASTLDAFSGGRFELGIGAGRPNADGDYRKLGIPFDSPGRRIDRLEESLAAIKTLFRDEQIDADGQHYTLAGSRLTPRPAQQPNPPILVAGTARRILSLAGREADIVGIGGRPDEPTEAIRVKIQWVRDAAGDRFDRIELNANLMAVGERVHPQALQWLGLDESEVLRSESPFIVIGSTNEMVEKLQRRRHELGLSYVLVSDAFMDIFAPVVERLAGS